MSQLYSIPQPGWLRAKYGEMGIAPTEHVFLRGMVAIHAPPMTWESWQNVLLVLTTWQICRRFAASR